jgi:predicted DCC family thiol-disulfide oxidoreductase YuxK
VITERHFIAMRPAFSYRADAAVPSFGDAHPIVFMDGECALCSGAARAIARLDRAGVVRICPVQSPLGRAVMGHFGLNADDPDTWLYLENGEAFGELDGLIRLARRIGGVAHLASVLALLPKGAQSRLYRWIARNRIAWFGRADLCAMPDSAVRARLIS